MARPLVPISSVLLLWTTLIISPIAAAADPFESRVCGTPDPTADEAAAIQDDLEQHPGASSAQSPLGGTVQVAFHVIWNGVEGDVTDAQIEAQVAEMNLDFAGVYGGYDTGYRFVLTSIDRTLNASWFTMAMGSNDEKRAKETLAIDPTHHINIYTAKIAALGWSTFPWGVAENDVHQGLVVHYGSLPGGNQTNFNLGRTVTHEAGHYFGLFHTFFTGCNEPNDYVVDTPEQATQTSGCPDEVVDSCPSPGPDPVHNYLDYSYDACYQGFTAGQDERMDMMLTTYRPNFLTAPLAVGATGNRGLWFRPATPTPASGPVTLTFGLSRSEAVTLRILDLAGRTVATLAGGVLPAGEHRRTFDAGARASGVYFAVLTAGGERVTRRLVFAR
jgi:pregnancy-associated plasma protein-A